MIRSFTRSVGQSASRKWLSKSANNQTRHIVMGRKRKEQLDRPLSLFSVSTYAWHTHLHFTSLDTILQTIVFTHRIMNKIFGRLP